jgi:hypothetical protein
MLWSFVGQMNVSFIAWEFNHEKIMGVWQWVTKLMIYFDLHLRPAWLTKMYLWFILNIPVAAYVCCTFLTSNANYYSFFYIEISLLFANIVNLQIFYIVYNYNVIHVHTIRDLFSLQKKKKNVRVHFFYRQSIPLVGCTPLSSANDLICLRTVGHVGWHHLARCPSWGLHAVGSLSEVHGSL